MDTAYYIQLNPYETTEIKQKKLAGISGIISVSEVTGSFDILCTCIFKNTEELFSLMENIKQLKELTK
jgi:hypothetical protein